MRGSQHSFDCAFMIHFNPNLQRPRKHNNPEGKLQLQIIHYCKGQGYIIGKTKTKGSQIGKRFLFDIYQFRGFPDLVLFTPKFFFIEVKAKNGVQSPEQKNFQILCINSGIPYILAKSLDDVITAIS